MSFVSILHDLLLIVGFCLTVYGTYLIYPPASFIICGLILLYTFRPRFQSTLTRKK